jgi:hypothetical protein
MAAAASVAVEDRIGTVGVEARDNLDAVVDSNSE